MSSNQHLENAMSQILLCGTFLAIALVLLGGIQYLMQMGGDKVNFAMHTVSPYQTSVKQILIGAMTFTPLGIISLGLLVLVLTQILRVVLLTFYYAYIRDYWFTLISLFITGVLIYSLLWR